jgi:hypothetical protein
VTNSDWAKWRAFALLGGLALAGCRQAYSDRISTAESTPTAEEQPPARPTEPAGPLTITWEQLDVGMEPDSVFEPWMMTTRIKALEGRKVRLTGYMCGAVFQRDNIRSFPLMRELECPFGPGGQAHHVVEVELQGKLRTGFTTELVTIEGVFSIQPRSGPNGKTWSLYRIDATQIE